MLMHLQDILLLVQESGMVPIVEPEVLMDGNHSAEIVLEQNIRSY